MKIEKNRDKIYRLKKEGFTVPEIAKKIGISKSSIYFTLSHPLIFKKCIFDKCSKETMNKLCEKHSYIGKISGRDFTRELIRSRDNHTCQICGKKWEEGTRRLDVHHKDNDKEKTKQYDVYEKEKDNLITLCHKCHLNLPAHRKSMTLEGRNK